MLLNNKALNRAHMGVKTPHVCSSVCVCSSALFPHNTQQRVMHHIMQCVYSYKVTYSLLTQVPGVYCGNMINKCEKSNLFSQQPSNVLTSLSDRKCWYRLSQLSPAVSVFLKTSWSLFQLDFFYWIFTVFILVINWYDFGRFSFIFRRWCVFSSVVYCVSLITFGPFHAAV